MLDPSDTPLKPWLDLLPTDYRRALESPEGETASSLPKALISELKESTPEAVAKIILRYTDDLRAVGRPGRIRLLAWVADLTYPDWAVMQAICSIDEEDTAGGAGTKSVGVLFLEDIQALNEVIAQRKAAMVLIAQNTDVALAAVRTLEVDMEQRVPGGL